MTIDFGVENQAQKLRLNVIDENIIRVTASPVSAFSEVESLMSVLPESDYNDWKAEEKEGMVVLSTPSIKAKISTATGAIIFEDQDGNVLLEELSEGGKTFTPSGINDGLFRVRQMFNAPDDEAFYGLGQHQHGYMNYKGKDVDLAQHNIVSVVPFLYSSKNYGILWDNYSITKFGDPRDYRQISDMLLFDAEGHPGGFTTTYFQGEKIMKKQVENKIDFRFLETESYEQLPKEATKIVWEGAIAAEEEGLHKFLLYASSYFKLWVDGKLVMDKWRQNWNPWSNPFEINIKNGEQHQVKVEWIPDAGYMSLTHLDPMEGNEQNQLSLASESGREIDYYFIHGNNADEVVSGYRKVTGKAPILPKWALGFWQSRERYKTQEELLDVVRTFRQKQIPIDNIVLDWFYWPEDQWGSHEMDLSRFPDAAAMTQTLHDDLNAHIMISVWPKYYKGTDHFNEMNEKGYLYRRNIEKARKDWVGPGYESTFYDAFNAGARDMFWSQINEQLFSKGFDAWWLDATEPDMHSNISIAERKLNMNPTALGPGELFFNGFSLMNSRGIYESQRQAAPNQRAFILTRSAYAGQQRYGAVTWSGDIVSRWSDMRDQISAGVNFCLSGIPYWTMDIGGFALETRYGAYGDTPTKENLDEWRELNTRWFQFGSFCPVFRVHGQFPYREVFNIAQEDHPAYQSMLYYNKLRYRLMPYIYAIAAKTYFDDYTIMRGLVMDFPNDKKVLNIDNQFMFGPSLLVNPVTEYGARKRDVYLPAGQGWYDFYTGAYLEGGQTVEAQADYTRIPLFVKAGSIIPAGQEIQFTNQKPDTLITLFVYAGDDAVFMLYNDEGINYNYENGSCSKVIISYDEKNGMLKIGQREGRYDGMPAEQRFNIVYISQETPMGFDPELKTGLSIVYRGEAVEVSFK
ncbi:MAG: DUF4968 domain-containing protein [Saprospiraceae bacterium]|nr:DUF4968 domain-containing protein [Saprospiraceae bacterium]